MVYQEKKFIRALKITKAYEKGKQDANLVNQLLITAEPYSDKPLTPEELKEKQKNLPRNSPWNPGQSPGPSRKTLAMDTGEATPAEMGFVSGNGFYIRNSDGRAFMQRGMKFYDAGDYDVDVHGIIVPLAEKKTRQELKIVHHTGGKHFTEPSMDELIQGLINGDIPRGTLGDEETENRMIQEYLNKQSLKIGDQKVANLPYQDGRAPTRPFYNAPYSKPDLFIKDKQSIDDAKKRFKLNTGIDLAKR